MKESIIRTTGLCAFDDLKSIVDVLENQFPSVWIHVGRVQMLQSEPGFFIHIDVLT